MKTRTDFLFDILKKRIIKYCLLNNESSLENEINYHIKIYEKYIDKINQYGR